MSPAPGNTFSESGLTCPRKRFPSKRSFEKTAMEMEECVETPRNTSGSFHAGLVVARCTGVD